MLFKKKIIWNNSSDIYLFKVSNDILEQSVKTVHGWYLVG